MNVTLLATITIIIYSLAVVFQIGALSCSWRFLKPLVWILGLSAVSLHCILLHEWINVIFEQNLNLLNLISLSAWLVALLLLVAVLVKPVGVLFIVVFPINALSILFILLFPSSLLIKSTVHPDMLFHILLAILTFCVLCLAGLLAILLALQEWLLRHRPDSKMIRQLPPLDGLEGLLFQVIALGFILLTVLLVTSFYFYHNLLFSHAVLLQKTVLAIAAWLIFAVLLWGRYQRGWRGRQAIYYTLAGVLLLFVIYFGSKFIMGTVSWQKLTHIY